MTFDAAQFQEHENVSRETIERLELYLSLLEAWNPSAGMIAKSTFADIWFRHVLDSAQLLRHFPNEARTGVDLGSGGGFPGMVLAVMSAERRPELQFALIEANQRRCQFLRHVSICTGVSVEVVSGRVESCVPQEADVVTSRGLASLIKLVGLAERHLKTGGTCVFPKGASHEVEIEEAEHVWEFTIENEPSVTREESAVLVLSDIGRRAVAE